MEIHRTQTTVRHGIVHLENVPLGDGEVEVIVQRKATKETAFENPLRGALLKYDDPFEPAGPPEDWEALQ